jgi:DNA processing protein
MNGSAQAPAGPGSAGAAPDRLARAVLTCVAEPGDARLGALLRRCPPVMIVSALTALGPGHDPGLLPGPGSGPGLGPGPGPGPDAGLGRSRLADGDAGLGRSRLADGDAGLGRSRLVDGDAGLGRSRLVDGDAGPGGRPAEDLRVAGGRWPGPGQRSPGLADLIRVQRAGGGGAALDRALRRWAARLGSALGQGDLDRWERAGIRLLCPGDPGWPGQLDVLEDARPYALWTRGIADLRFACLRSVSIVGTRAATPYGEHVAAALAAGLAENGWSVVSGGALGIDGRAHRGALAAGGTTIAVLPSGVDEPYPRSHQRLFEDIAASGLLVSEWPPGRTPTRPGFLVRNRVIAALSRGTVVVEAALRSGALNTARHARDLGRPLMAVPGPVTSMTSAGCHQAIREWAAECVTAAADVLAALSFEPGEQGRPECLPVLPRDALASVTRDILEALPARGGWGPARIAVSAGVDLDTALAGLGELAAAGFVERCERGWRLRRARSSG